MALSWDEDAERVIIEAAAAAAEEAEEEAEEIDLEDDENGPDILRVRVTGSVARAFVKRALAVVEAGRPPCPFCGQPLDPDGSHLPAVQRVPPAGLTPCGAFSLTSDWSRDDWLGAEAGFGLPAQPDLAPRGRPAAAGRTASSTCRDGSSTRATPRCSVLRRSTACPPCACTSRSRGSGRCGTSRRGRWPVARSRRTSSPRRPAGTSFRPPSCARDRSGRACASSGSTSTRRSTSGCWCGPSTPTSSRMVVLDAVVNNADRKGGHLLPRAGRSRAGGRPRRHLQRRGQAPHRALGLAAAKPLRRRGGRRARVARA